MSDRQPDTTEPNGLCFYGLRAARGLIAQMRKDMAADPMVRRSQDPFTRGQREALKALDLRIQQAMEACRG